MKKCMLVFLLSSITTQVLASDALVCGALLSAAAGGLAGAGYVGKEAFKELVEKPYVGDMRGIRPRSSNGKLVMYKVGICAAAGTSAVLVGTLACGPYNKCAVESAAVATAALWLVGGKNNQEEDRYKNTKRLGGIAGAALVSACYMEQAIDDVSSSTLKMILGIYAGRALAEKLAKLYHTEPRQ